MRRAKRKRGRRPGFRNRLTAQELAAHKAAVAFRVATKRVAEVRGAGPRESVSIREVFPTIASELDTYAIGPRSEIVSRVITLLGPAYSSEDEYRIIVANLMDFIRVQRISESIPQFGVVRKKIGDVVEALDDLKKSIDALPLVARTYQSNEYWETLREFIDGVRQTTSACLKEIGQPAGHRGRDLTKAVAVDFAFRLMQRIGRERPTKTVGGQFFELASILYEGGTGISGANLQRPCREYLDALDQSLK